VLVLGNMAGRYRDWIASNRIPRGPSGTRGFARPSKRPQPRGCDFPSLGPHSLRRANITWRQEVGGSAIEASRIAGHANTKITEEYTIVQLKRQEELTRRIRDKLAAAKRDHEVHDIRNGEAA
jgi:integrase